MNEKALDVARDTNTTNSIISLDDLDSNKIHDHAHTLNYAVVASLLATDIQ